MHEFFSLLPDLQRSGRFELLTLASEADGWLVEFTLHDPDTASVTGCRTFPKTPIFEDLDDLMDELWCTPNLFEV